MADRSPIEWTDATWNPVTGCTRVSAGCDNCYAERFSERFRGVPGHPFSTGFDLTLRPERLEQPLAWKKSRMIFVNSMSDLFHKNVPLSYVAQVFDVMERADQHVFQVLTKRSSLMRNFVNARYGTRAAPSHIWLGVSIESPKLLVRLEHLQQARASVRFISFEPLLERMGKLVLDGVDWERTPRAADKAWLGP
jgi:protein gp37